MLLLVSSFLQINSEKVRTDAATLKSLLEADNGISLFTVPYFNIFSKLLVNRSSRPYKETTRSQNSVQLQKKFATYTYTSSKSKKNPVKFI